jgi:transposase
MPAGRPLLLPQTIHNHDFALLAKTENHSRTRVRLLGLHNLQKGKGLRETAEILGVHEQSVKSWLTRFSKDGLEGLREQKGRGNKRKLSEEHQEVFQEAILELQANCHTGRIRGADVLKLMREKLGINCCLDTAYETLKRAQFVGIKAHSQHPKADEAEQEDFKKTSSKS